MTQPLTVCTIPLDFPSLFKEVKSIKEPAESRLGRTLASTLMSVTIACVCRSVGRVGDARGMISFDTFTADDLGSRSGTPSGSPREPRRSCDLFHEGPSSSQSSSSDDVDEQATTAATASPPESIGRIAQVFQLLSLPNATGAKSALVQRLLGVSSMSELLLTKATEEQIASAANDAITDEILASVDQEEQRRMSNAAQRNSLDSGCISSSSSSEPSMELVVHNDQGFSGTYRVLELVDLLDTSTGGIVKRVLTNVHRRTPFSLRNGKHLDKSIEFCRFCSAYRDHRTLDHKCRICGVSGHHRSRNCASKGSPATSTATTSTTNGSSYCKFCSSWGAHSTERHQCRRCGASGEHRSNNCTKKAASRWRGSPQTFTGARNQKFCDFCGSWRAHASSEHRCRICYNQGVHRSKDCPMNPSGTNKRRMTEIVSSPASSSSSPAQPAINPTTSSPAIPGLRSFCSFCSKRVAHESSEHICRVCREVGLHRSSDCSQRKESQSVLSYSVETASKVRDRVLEKIPLARLPSTLVWEGIDKVGDVDTIVRKTLRRIGVWGGGSQTPITTPYAAPFVPASGDVVPSHLVAPSAVGVYVLSYAEGHSVVPERILKYMRLLMHHEISTNAFSVVVRFDSRSSMWELQKPGMVTPRSLPSSPTMSEQLKKRMANYTLELLLGTREKLIKLVLAQRHIQFPDQQAVQEMFAPAQHHAQSDDEDDDEFDDDDDEEFDDEDEDSTVSSLDDEECKTKRAASSRHRQARSCTLKLKP